VVLKRTAPRGVGLGLPSLADEFGHVRSRVHHEQATVIAPRAVRCPSRGAPCEPSSLPPAPDSPTALLKLAPFVDQSEAPNIAALTYVGVSDRRAQRRLASTTNEENERRDRWTGAVGAEGPPQDVCDVLRRARPGVVGRDPRPFGRRRHLPPLRPPRPAGVRGDHDDSATDRVLGADQRMRRRVPVLPEAICRRGVMSSRRPKRAQPAG
jgi:hypothetical protein